MSTWNPKRPLDLYPALWHQIVLGEPGVFLIAEGATDSRARKIAQKFSSFRAGLRLEKGTAVGKAFAGKRIILSKTTNGPGLWNIWAKVMLREKEDRVEATPQKGKVRSIVETTTGEGVRKIMFR